MSSWQTMTAAQQGRLLAREGGAPVSNSTATEIWERVPTNVLQEEQKILGVYRELLKGLERGETKTATQLYVADAQIANPGGMISAVRDLSPAMLPPPGSKVTAEESLKRVGSFAKWKESFISAVRKSTANYGLAITTRRAL